MLGAVNRKGTASVKWDLMGAHLRDGQLVMPDSAVPEDMLPMWVADMDAAVPAVVTDAIAERLAHPVFGYGYVPESLYRAHISWCQRVHGIVLAREWMRWSEGTMSAIRLIVSTTTQPGEPVVVPAPVYGPFYHAVTARDRELRRVALTGPAPGQPGSWELDLEKLDTAMAGARVLLLCQPHNPVGRVWSETEITALLDLAQKHDVLVVSDEIHGDLVLNGKPFPSLARWFDGGVRIAVVQSPNKTFNIPSLSTAMVCSPDPDLLTALARERGKDGPELPNPLSMAGAQAALLGADNWLNQVRAEIAEHHELVREVMADTPVRVADAEASYLAWLDFRALGGSSRDWRHRIARHARAWLSTGTEFGPEGEGFLRMNVATGKEALEAVLHRIRDLVLR